MKPEKILNLLGIAFKARQVISGQELVYQAMKKKQAKFVFLACDMSQSASKKFVSELQLQHIDYIDYFSQTQLSNAIGRPRKTIAVIDDGFAQRLRELSIMK